MKIKANYKLYRYVQNAFVHTYINNNNNNKKDRKKEKKKNKKQNKTPKSAKVKHIMAFHVFIKNYRAHE